MRISDHLPHGQLMKPFPVDCLLCHSHFWMYQCISICRGVRINKTFCLFSRSPWIYLCKLGFPLLVDQGGRGFKEKNTCLEKNPRIFRSANQKQKCFELKSSVNSYPFPLIQGSFESSYHALPQYGLKVELPRFVFSIFTKVTFPPNFDPDPLISTWIGPASRVPGSILTKIGSTHVTFPEVGYPSVFHFLSLFSPMSKLNPTGRVRST